MRYPLLSLFTGAGGLDFACEAAGFATALAVECQPAFRATLAANQGRGVLADACLLAADVRSLEPRRAWDEHVADAPFGLVGGPPCESFTPIGKQLGRHDPRGGLVFTFAAWARALPFRFVLLENVPGLATMEDGALLRELLAELDAAGYATSHAVLNAADFGAATVRKRLFVVGVRGGPAFDFPKATHPRERWVGAGAVLGDLPAPADRQPGEPTGHVRIHHTPAVRERFAAVPPGGWDNVRKRARLAWDRPSPSLYAGNLAGVRGHIHPTEPRELTNRELARIQGFPDWFEFAGGRVPAGKQIANAVPLPLGRAVAAALAAHLGVQP